ncbi:MAG TPA: circularly permuted type 2 ATP-grasp protein [Polyangiales bacterium]|nr:circularly permuted type 2 ATP-grasp protein [Polyangiales bacterium]
MAPPDTSGGPADLVSGYPTSSGVYDELRDQYGVVRPHFRALFQQLHALGHDALERRWDKATQLLHDNGVSYNVYGDPQGTDRPWNLSPIPAVLSSGEFQQIEDGLVQRARLLDALLADLYGAQRVLQNGLLPAELVFSNPGFLRPCHGFTQPRDQWLPIYAADLVREPSGAFAVLEDRTQTPSGPGYALENRLVISSVLPEAFRDCNVARLASFFRALRETLDGLAPHNRDNPRIVLLTPGPYNATYFEQAYLAQYLGYTLVNGNDLTVRKDRVLLKTLGGLQPVDVILRRVNDDYCDPLELRPESLLGVPGLLQAARAGNVAIANPLGTGLLRTSAFLPYLAGLARGLLGEELRLPSVRTLWCGDPAAFSEAEAMFDDAVVKAAHPVGFVQPIVTARLSTAERAALFDKVRARPADYVVQEHVQVSVTPHLDDGQLTPRSLVTRCFAVASRGGYMVMPGGLARVAGTQEGTELSLQLGARSKDLWVLSDGPAGHFSLLPSVHRPVELSRGGSDLPSRAADNLYWLGRYAERAEDVARTSRVACARLSELGGQRDLERSTEIASLLRALNAQTTLLYTGALESAALSDFRAAERELVRAVLDETVAGSLHSAVRSTLRTGRLVRDRISTDTWRVLAALEDELLIAEREADHDTLGVLYDALNRVILRLAAFSGLAIDSMTRGHAFRFLDMGRRLERAMGLVTLLRSTLVQRCDREGPLLESVLEIADSGMTYRRRYLASLQHAPVVDLLLVDESNPRSVIYQLDAIGRYLAELPQPTNGLRSAQERSVLGMLTSLRLCDIERLCEEDSRGERPALAALLLDLATRIPTLSDSLSDRYLAHASVSRHLGYDDSVHEPQIERGSSPPSDHALQSALQGDALPAELYREPPQRESFPRESFPREPADLQSFPPMDDNEPTQEGVE